MNETEKAMLKKTMARCRRDATVPALQIFVGTIQIALASRLLYPHPTNAIVLSLTGGGFIWTGIFFLLMRLSGAWSAENGSSRKQTSN
jgi:hypothetical protein